MSINSALWPAVAGLLILLAATADAADLRLDVIQVDDKGAPVAIASQSILTFIYSVPLLTVYVRQDAIYSNGFEP